MKSIRVHGSNGSDKYDNIYTGLNGRLDTIQAAILLEKLSIFDNELKLREKVSDFYDKNISKKFIKQYIPKRYFSSRAQYSLLAESNDIRNEVVLFLNKIIYHP